MIPRQSSGPAYLQGPAAFITHYIKRHAASFGTLLFLVACAAGAAVSTQYVMKLLVDGMAGGSGARSEVWTALGLFIGLIAFESVCWRLTGWLTCRTTVGVGVDMRLDLFEYLNGQPMRYFAEHLAGSLGQRITMTAGNFGALVNTFVWRGAPPPLRLPRPPVLFSPHHLRVTGGPGNPGLPLTGPPIRCR